MLQNPCKTLGFKKNMVYKIPPGGEVNHIQPVAYKRKVKEYKSKEEGKDQESIQSSITPDRGQGMEK